MISRREPDCSSEWLLTNGVGGFAMGTPSGVNVRRYHGLLVAAVNPPVDRMVCLNSTIDQFHPTGEEGRYLPLSSQLFGGSDTPHPNGWEYQVDFDCDTRSATWTWVLDGGITVRKKLALEQGCNSCLLEWSVDWPCARRHADHQALGDHARLPWDSSLPGQTTSVPPRRGRAAASNAMDRP